MPDSNATKTESPLGNITPRWKYLRDTAPEDRQPGEPGAVREEAKNDTSEGVRTTTPLRPPAPPRIPPRPQPRERPGSSERPRRLPGQRPPDAPPRLSDDNDLPGWLRRSRDESRPGASRPTGALPAARPSSFADRNRRPDALPQPTTVRSYEDFRETLFRQYTQRVLGRRLRILYTGNAQQTADLREDISAYLEDLRQSDSLHVAGRPDDVARVWAQAAEDLIGFGPAQDLLDNPDLRELQIHGMRAAFVDWGQGRESIPVPFRDQAQLDYIISRLMAQPNANPDRRPGHNNEVAYTGFLLVGGEQITVTHQPLYDGEGPLLIIRKPVPVQGHTLDDLSTRGVMPPVVAGLLRGAVQAQLNLLVIGGPGSGRFAMLNALADAIPGSEMVVSMEQETPLQLVHPNLIRLQIAPPPPHNSDGASRFGSPRSAENAPAVLDHVAELGPDRLVIGDLRGREVRNLVRHLHHNISAWMGTTYGFSISEAFSRLYSYAGGGLMNMNETRGQLARAIDLVVRMVPHAGGYRILSVESILSWTEQTTVLYQPDPDTESAVFAEEAPAFIQRLEALPDPPAHPWR